MTKVINLSDLKTESAVTIVIKDADGVEKSHKMRIATVESFIENVALIESLGTDASMKKEVELMVTIIDNAFPTLKRAEIMQWPIEHISKISEVARGHNNELVTTDLAKAEEAEETGNV